MLLLNYVGCLFAALYPCIVMVKAINLCASYLTQIDIDSFRILGQKYRLPSPKCGRSEIGLLMLDSQCLSKKSHCAGDMLCLLLYLSCHSNLQFCVRCVVRYRITVCSHQKSSHHTSSDLKVLCRDMPLAVYFQPLSVSESHHNQYFTLQKS